MFDPRESLSDGVDVRVGGGGAGAGADLLVGAAVTRRGLACMNNQSEASILTIDQSAALPDSSVPTPGHSSGTFSSIAMM